MAADIVPDKLPLGKFFAWKTRDVALACSVIVNGYITIYCTDTLKIPAAMVGTILLASKVFDGITDLFAGYIVDNTNSRWGKGRPYEFSILGVWLFTWLLYSCPDIGLNGKMLWVFCCYSFINAIFATMLGVSGTPYVIRAFGSERVVVKLQSYGGLVTTLFAGAISIAFPILMGRMIGPGGSGGDSGWSTLIGMFALPLALVGILRFFLVKETYNMDTNTQRISFREIFRVFRSNRYVWILSGVGVLVNILIGMNVSSYYFTYIVGDIGKYGTLQMFLAVMLLVMFVFPKIVKKYSIAALIRFGAFMGLCGGIINFFAGQNMIILGIGFVCTSFAALPTSYLFGVMVLQCASYNEWKGHRRMEGTMATVSGFGNKVGGGLGSAFLGLFLGWAGYDGATAVQSDQAFFMIRCLYSVIPSFVYLALIIVVSFFTLEKMLPQIERENAERRASAAKS